MRNFRATTLPLLALALLVPAATPRANAQEQQPNDRFEERVEVNEVALDVLVTDTRGNVIVGLTPQDFVVRENGKPVELTGITFYSNRRLLDSAQATDQKGVKVDRVPEDRFFILFFEDQKDVAAESPGIVARQLEAGRRAREWVSQGRLPSDWVAVVSYDQKLKIQQDFTRDGGALVDAINDAMKGKDREGNYPSRIRKGDGPSLYASLPQGKELRNKTPTIYEALQVLSDAAGDVRGRKNLILFSTGFGQVNSFGQYTPDPRYEPQMLRALNDNNVAVYTIDLLPAGTEHPLSSAMSKLADETGGKYYSTFNNFSTPLQQIAEENSGYYLLSYRSEQPAGKRGFQEVEVSTSNPEFRVRARKGYAFGEEPGR